MLDNLNAEIANELFSHHGKERLGDLVYYQLVILEARICLGEPKFVHRETKLDTNGDPKCPL